MPARPRGEHVVLACRRPGEVPRPGCCEAYHDSVVHHTIRFYCSLDPGPLSDNALDTV